MTDDTKDTILYGRVSTTDQNIDHQMERLWELATDDRDIDPSRIVPVSDEATGRNTERDGYKEMMRKVREGEAELVICRSLSRLGRNMRDIYNTVYEIVEDHNAGLIVRKDGIEIEPGDELDTKDKVYINALGLAADIEADLIRERTLEGLRAAERAGKEIGRPIYGFSGEDGSIYPNENYKKAVMAILADEELGWSHRKIERQIGVPRRTVPRILNRKDVYLDDRLHEDEVNDAVDELTGQLQDDIRVLEEYPDKE